MTHISDHDLERYCLGMFRNKETQLAVLEEHLLVCVQCVNRAEQTQDYVDALRVGLLKLSPL
jgi:hypothetical protein